MRPRHEDFLPFARLRTTALGAALAALAVLACLVPVAPLAHARPRDPEPPAVLLLDTDPGPSGSLVLEKGRMRHAVGRDNGTLRISGVFDVRDQAVTFADRVLADGSSVQIADGGSFYADLALVGCRTLRRSIRCKSPDRGVQASFRATDVENVYKMILTAKKLSVAVTGSPQPRGPITVLFFDGAGVDRSDVLSDCESSGRHALRCKH